MKAILIKAGTTDNVSEVEVNDNDVLSSLYDFISCSYIQCIVRKIGSREFDIICDEEGRFVTDNQVSAFDPNTFEDVVGNLILCHHNDEGDWTSIVEGDIEEVKNNLLTSMIPGMIMFEVVKISL